MSYVGPRPIKEFFIFLILLNCHLVRVAISLVSAMFSIELSFVQFIPAVPFRCIISLSLSYQACLGKRERESGAGVGLIWSGALIPWLHPYLFISKRVNLMRCC